MDKTMVKKIDRSDTITNFLFFFLFFRREQDKHTIFVKALWDPKAN